MADDLTRMACAMQSCIDIACYYETKEEVKKFAPQCVQEAWLIGTKYLKEENKKTKEQLKDFIL